MGRTGPAEPGACRTREPDISPGSRPKPACKASHRRGSEIDPIGSFYRGEVAGPSRPNLFGPDPHSAAGAPSERHRRRPWRSGAYLGLSEGRELTGQLRAARVAYGGVCPTIACRAPDLTDGQRRTPSQQAGGHRGYAMRETTRRGISGRIGRSGVLARQRPETTPPPSARFRRQTDPHSKPVGRCMATRHAPSASASRNSRTSRFSSSAFGVEKRASRRNTTGVR